MLAKLNRIPRLIFGDVLTSGKRIHGNNSTIVISQSPIFKCSVVVSKKVAKKAHERNRIKRRLYALVRELIRANSPALALIIMIKPTITNLTKTEFKAILQAEIGRALNNR